jgi:hypothetical protein
MLNGDGIAEPFGPVSVGRECSMYRGGYLLLVAVRWTHLYAEDVG